MTKTDEEPVLGNQTEGFPHSYKEQRKFERMAKADRDKTLSRGGSLPPICGWMYRPRSNNRTKATEDLTEVMCYRTAGAGTKHHGSGFCDYHEISHNRTSRRDGGVQGARTVAYKQARFFGEPLNIGPHEALLGEVQRTAGIVRWLEEKLQRLSDDGTPEDQVLAQFTKQHGLQPSVWMLLYSEERERLVKVSAAAIKAGVAERKVQIAEQQARLIASLMMNFIHDPELGLTPGQLMAAPMIVRKHMIEIGSFDGGRSTERVVEATFQE